ncbi:MAG TPA: hypothetical protein VK663_04430 [Burkholderiales bacterium]|nr:hypothetical protein [Burkholderiales bacterium]
MAKFYGFLFSLLMFSLAHADEIKDAPVGEPNYIGIIVFLGLLVGVGVWYMWKVMNNKGDAKK